MTVKDHFYEWAEDNYFNNYMDIVSDLKDFNLTETTKVIEKINEFDEILSGLGITNRLRMVIKMDEIKKKFSFNEMYKLKTYVLLLIRRLNLQ
jgi:hypothetical protein